MKIKSINLAALIVMLCQVISASAITIDFENDEGYQVDASPVGLAFGDYSWSGSDLLGKIVPGQGVDNSNSLYLRPIGFLTTLQLHPTNQDIPTKMRFSILVKLEKLAAESTQVPLQLKIASWGDATACSVVFYESGKVDFFSSEKSYRAKNKNGDEFLLKDGAYTRLDVWLDFKNNTYKLALDDMEQSLDGEKNIPFSKILPVGGLGDLLLVNKHATAGGVLVDSINWEKVD
jgi:hypothetical protein